MYICKLESCVYAGSVMLEYRVLANNKASIDTKQDRECSSGCNISDRHNPLHSCSWIHPQRRPVRITSSPTDDSDLPISSFQHTST